MKNENYRERAFPHEHYRTLGMSLRDYFAAKAMQGLLAAGGGVVRTADEWGDLAYVLADSMLEARK